MKWPNKYSWLVLSCVLLVSSCRTPKQIERYEDVSINRLNNIRQISEWGIILDDTIIISIVDTVRGQWVPQKMITRSRYAKGGDTTTTQQHIKGNNITESKEKRISHDYTYIYYLAVIIVLVVIIVVFFKVIGI